MTVSRWRHGQEPRLADTELPAGAGAGDRPPDEVRWIDVSIAALETRAEPGARPEPGARAAIAELHALIAPLCEGQLDEPMLSDLLACGRRPENHCYSGDQVRLFVAFQAESHEVSETDPDSGVTTLVKMMVYQPVGFLAGDGWIVTCWYHRQAYEGGLAIGHRNEPRPHDDVARAVARRWRAAPARTAGDLGVLILDELALSYAPAHRKIYDWLEAWELTLYLDTDIEGRRGVVDRTTLPDLWGTTAVLRYWLRPLNRPGMRADVDKAWFAGCTDHQAVNEVNDRIDRSLQSLRDLGSTLRSSFGLLHIQLAEAQHERTERLQNLIEYVTAAVLIPALVVGFYGVNTELPGEGTWWGFWTMVGAMVVLAGGSAIFLRLVRGRPGSDVTATVAYRARARAGLALELGSEDE